MAEIFAFMRTRKKFWLLPILLSLLIFGGLVILTQGSAVAPFYLYLVLDMYILGISAFYHDSAAALIQDGKIIAAAQEERFYT